MDISSLPLHAQKKHLISALYKCSDLDVKLVRRYAVRQDQFISVVDVFFLPNMPPQTL